LFGAGILYDETMMSCECSNICSELKATKGDGFATATTPVNILLLYFSFIWVETSLQ
jgi:hypothetical protein